MAGVGKVERTHFSIIRGFSEIKIKLDMQSVNFMLHCTPWSRPLSYICIRMLGNIPPPAIYFDYGDC